MIRTKPSTPAYRDGWERAFRKKVRCIICGKPHKVEVGHEKDWCFDCSKGKGEGPCPYPDEESRPCAIDNIIGCHECPACEPTDRESDGTCPYPIEVGCTKECSKSNNCSSYIEPIPAVPEDTALKDLFDTAGALIQAASGTVNLERTLHGMVDR